MSISAERERWQFGRLDRTAVDTQQDVARANASRVGRPAFVDVLKKPTASVRRIEGTERGIDRVACWSTLRTLMEKRDVAETAAGHDGVYARLKLRGRTGSDDVLHLFGEQRSPVRVSPVETNAPTFEQSDPLLDHIADN
jgi:hypothetical protein